jgi:plastocyanin
LEIREYLMAGVILRIRGLKCKLACDASLNQISTGMGESDSHGCPPHRILIRRMIRISPARVYRVRRQQVQRVTLCAKRRGHVYMAFRRLLYSSAAVALMVANVGVVPARAATPQTFTIGVDNASPRGHNFLYVDFFPRDSVRVHSGDVVDFSWNTGSPDGAHTVMLPPTGGSTMPFVVPDSDDGATQFEASPAVFGPSDPTCGSAANPCDYTGVSRVNSGFLPNATGNAPANEFFVKLDVPAETVNFFCELHPGMHGSVQVVPDGTPTSTASQIQAAAQAQYATDTQGALAAEQATESRAVVQNQNGGPTVTVTAGTATQFVEVAEMLPRTVHLEDGHKVNWVTQTIRDVHTVTFPEGHGSDGVDPLVSVCEASPVDLASPPATCAPQDSETHINGQPQGSTVIRSPSSVGTSGIIGNPPPGTPVGQFPFPNNFSFVFPNEGAFTYQCRIHDHMVGTVIVEN